MSAINITQLANSVARVLTEYEGTTNEIVEEAVKYTAQRTVFDIAEAAGGLFNGNKYAQSWAYKRMNKGRGVNHHAMVVYSKPPYYRIAHLLENGHAKVGGGRVEGRPHIRPAENIAIDNLRYFILKKLSEGRQ